jgi:PAS domain S-box-containing protein
MSALESGGDLVLENAELRERLAEAESVLQAIRRGDVDAVVVSGPGGDRVFTLEGADHPYRMLVESMNEGAATLDPEGVVLYGNPRLATLLEITNAELVGTRISDWVVPEDEAALAALIEVGGGEPGAGELTLLTSRGVELPVHASFSRVVLADANLRCAIITDLRLEKHRVALEIAAKHIREANLRLREADQRKDEFLATLAHELRNPLAPIRSAAHLLKMLNPDDHTIVQAQNMIERQVTHITRLVDDLLELSRITLGRIELQRRAENLTEILRGVVDAASSVFDFDQTFEAFLPNEALPIDADAVRLSQAISNVLENAAKYTPADGRITLRVDREAKHAVISVRDTGIGIAPDMLSRVFEMFVQAGDDADRTHEGLGIGLSLTRRLIEMHGGTIEAASPGRGAGSEFTIRLPLIGAAEDHGADRPRASDDAVAAPKVVLVVDDNVDAAESLRALLELSGHTVRLAHDGRSALDALNDFRPDFVLLDIGLPDLDGYEVARRVRARFGTDWPVLVALSGWGRAEDKQRATEAGIDAHFTKPIDPDALMRLFAQDSG